MFNQQAFQAAGFSQQNFTTFQAVGAEEATHVQFLAKAISGAGGTPVAPCNYTFPASDVKSFLAVSSILEGVSKSLIIESALIQSQLGVGVSAYLGAAAAVQDKTILTAAASIMTVEARHNAFVRSVIQQAPNPNAFDNPLSPMEVFTLASTFITSCPSSNAQLPFTAFPSLALGSNSTVNPGSMITVTTPGYTLVPAPGNQLFGAFITVAGPMFAPATATANGFSLQVPQGLSGQSYMVMTSSNTNVTDATTAAGPLLVEVSFLRHSSSRSKLIFSRSLLKFFETELWLITPDMYGC